MSTISRGVRNSFRNPIRTGGVTVILGLSVGLALVMLLSLKAVQNRIDTVKASIGNTITVSPAGARGFDGGGEPLTQAQVDSLKSVAHVTQVTSTVSDRLTPTTDTSLASAIDPGTLGNRFRNRGLGTQTNPGAGAPATSSGATRSFSIPIMVTGVTTVTPAALNATSIKLVAGATLDGSKASNTAEVGQTLATKNNLTVGSTFTAYSGTKFTVVGIYDAGNTFANAGLLIPISTAQVLSGQAGQVSNGTVTVDSVTNLDATVTSIKAKLGTAADVTSDQTTATTAIAPLESIRTVSLYSLIGALAAGAVITFLTMLMIVRERRREIGVLKAIGASNFKITSQFVAEAFTLTLLGSVIGLIGGIVLSNPILKLLVTSNAATSPAVGAGGGRGFGRAFGAVSNFGTRSLSTLTTTIGLDVLLYGLAAALIIAFVGSALPAWLIAKVRPAEVMRGE
jgi:putative ABC transport system permease protein